MHVQWVGDGTAEAGPSPTWALLRSTTPNASEPGSGRFTRSAYVGLWMVLVTNPQAMPRLEEPWPRRGLV